MLARLEVGVCRALASKYFRSCVGTRSTHTAMAGPACSSRSNDSVISSGKRRSSTTRKLAPPRTHLFITLAFLVTLLSLPSPSHAVKFELPATHYPTPKCIWNYAHPHALIIITANVAPGNAQRVDVEVRDREGGPGNIYLSKRDIKGETRLAVTAHAEGDVGVCFKNTLDACTCLLSK
jgi:hypothetical protein